MVPTAWVGMLIIHKTSLTHTMNHFRWQRGANSNTQRNLLLLLLFFPALKGMGIATQVLGKRRKLVGLLCASWLSALNESPLLQNKYLPFCSYLMLFSHWKRSIYSLTIPKASPFVKNAYTFRYQILLCCFQFMLVGSNKQYCITYLLFDPKSVFLPSCDPCNWNIIVHESTKGIRLWKILHYLP